MYVFSLLNEVGFASDNMFLEKVSLEGTENSDSQKILVIPLTRQ